MGLGVLETVHSGVLAASYVVDEELSKTGKKIDFCREFFSISLVKMSSA